MPDPTPLRTAEIDPAIKPYFMWQIVLVCVLTIIGIPLLVVAIPLGFSLIQRYIDNLQITLTERTLEVNRGVLSKIESTIPLDKITDLQMFQGPIMRMMGLRGFKVETAGQSAGPGGSLVSIIGIIDAPAFRKAVLAQRDAREDGRSAQRDASPEPAGRDDLLREIRDVLVRIEGKLSNRE